VGGAALSGLRLTILADNNAGPGGLTALWGFSALVETGDLTILFDTGSNGRVLLKNMAALGVDPGSVDTVFLSHADWDHLGGLDSVLEAAPDATVVLHGGFSKRLIGDLRGLCREVVVVGPEPCRIAPGVFSTGMLEGPPAEQALVLQTGAVTALVTGCAHPGVVHLAERGVSLLEGPVRWVIGGLHLMESSEEKITAAVRALQDLGVTDVVPTHCSGDAAVAAFGRAYGSRCVPGGVGRSIDLPLS